MTNGKAAAIEAGVETGVGLANASSRQAPVITFVVAAFSVVCLASIWFTIMRLSSFEASILAEMRHLSDKMDRQDAATNARIDRLLEK